MVMKHKYSSKAEEESKEINCQLIGLSIGTIVIFAILYIVFGYTSGEKVGSPLTKITASNEIVRYKVECLRAANVLGSSPAFANRDRILECLENCGETVSIAGYSLEAMFQYGNSLITAFNTEVSDTIKTLHANTPINIPDYIDTKRAFLHAEIKEYQFKVAHTKDLVLLAEQAQHMAEKELINGKRNGEKYLEDRKKKFGYSIEYKNAVEELSMIDKLLNQIHVVAQQLGQMHINLLHYDDILSNMETKIKDKGGIFVRDIEVVWQLGESLKDLHERALNKTVVGRC